MMAYEARNRKILISLIVFSVLLTFLGVYIPMKRELDSTTMKNFTLVAEANIMVFRQAVDSDVQSAAGISSRSSIRDAISRYLEGGITFAALQQYTDAKYRDGLSVIPHLAYASRVVEGKTVVAFSGGLACEADRLEAQPDVIEKRLRIGENGLCLEIVSSIKSGQTVLGYDYFGFSLDEVMASLNTGSRRLSLVAHTRAAPEVQAAPDLSAVPDLPAGASLWLDDSSAHYRIPFDDTMDLLVSQPRSELFANQRILTKWVLVSLMLGYFFMIGMVHLFIVRHAKRQLQTLHTDKERIQKDADTDALTGARTRSYLTRFLSGRGREEGMLLFLDLDNLKGINDAFGHETGDRVIQMVAHAIRKAIRETDVVVRYGGDEFVVIMMGQAPRAMEDTVRRMKQGVDEENRDAIPIDFSFGAVPFADLHHVDGVIATADALMYQNKKSKKAGNTPRR